MLTNQEEIKISLSLRVTYEHMKPILPISYIEVGVEFYLWRKKGKIIDNVIYSITLYVHTAF